MRFPLPLLLLAVAAAAFGPFAPVASAAAPGARVDPWKVHSAVLDREDAFYSRNALSESQRLLDSLLAASRAGRDEGLERVVTARLARHATASGRFDDAAALARRAIALAESRRDTLTVLRALRTLALVHERKSETEKGLAVCTRGSRLARAARLPRERFAFELRRGYLHITVRQDRLARASFESAVRLAESYSDEGDLMRSLSGLADACYTSADYAASRVAYDRAVALARKRDDPAQLTYLLLNYGRMEQAGGDPDRSPGLFRGSLEAARRVGMTSYELEAVRQLAEFEVARGAWNRVDSIMNANIPRAEPLKDRAPLLGMLITGARARIELGRPAEAQAFLRRALALTDSVLPMNAAFHAQVLVYAEHQAKRDSSAVQLADDLLARLAKRVPAAELWRVRFYRALALSGMGRSREAAAGLHETVARTRPTATQPAGIEHSWALAELGVVHHELGQIDSSLYWYRAAIRQWETDRSESSLEELLADSEDMGNDIGYSYAHALLDGRRRRPEAARAIEAFTELQRFHALALTERLLGPAVGAAARRKPFDFAAWRSGALRPGEVFVDITPGEDSSLVIAVTRSQIQAWMLPGKDALEKRLGRFSEMLSRGGRDEKSMRDVAASLGAELFGPGAGLITGARSVLVSAGRLGAYPLGSLVVPGTNGALSLEREFSFVPSATLLGVARARTGARVAPPHALVAVARTSDDRGRRLPAAGDEVRALGRAYGGTLTLVDPRRTALQLAGEALARGRIVHVAAHASVDERHPWQSRLLLGDPARGGAYLAVSSISRLRLPARLCVLASCRSLGSAGVDNSSLAGLAPAWLMAGASSVVAAQWDVDDRATAEFMKRFYAALSGGATVAGSLRSAQLGMRSSAEWAEPRHWAGFVVLGDPGTRVTLAARR